MNTFLTSLISWKDIFIFIPYFLIILFFAFRKKNKNINENPAYKFYVPGLVTKIISSIIFCFVYVYYYGGGDSTAYFHDSLACLKIFESSFNDFVSLMFNGLDDKYYFYGKYGEVFWIVEDKSFFVIRLILPLTIITFKSYIVSTILLVWICYGGIWKLYLMFCEIYPQHYKQLAFGVLFIPSVVFWGSSILKDTITLSAMGYFVYSFYHLFLKKDRILVNFLVCFLSAIIIIKIKPYVFIALLPGSLIWGFNDKIHQQSNKVIRTFFAPVLIVVSLFISITILSFFKDSLGTYSSVDNILQKAKLTQADLIRSEQYGKNYHNIGEFDASFTGIAEKFPSAVFAGLYRPLIWEARNATVFISALENTFILVLTLFILIRVGPVKTFKFIESEPLLLFSIIFVIFFSFSVGLTTANFGALVRYRIPATPFFVASLLIIYLKLFVSKN